MKNFWLKIKVFFVVRLRALNLLPDVWYQCEIDLAEIKAKEYMEFFNKEEKTNE